MTIILPAIVCVLYALTGAFHAGSRRWDWAVVWWGYAIAQIGLIAASR